MKRRILFSIIGLLLCVPAVFAGVSTKPGISVSAGGAFCIPTAGYLQEYPGDSGADMPPVRTSFSLGTDAVLLDLSVSRVSFGAGLSYVYTSRSLAYGRSVLRAYSGFGPLVSLGYDFSGSFSLGLKLRYMRCCFSGSRSSFICAEAEAVPMFRVFSGRASDGFLCVPVTVSYKSDAVTVRTGVSFTLRFDSSRMGSAGSGRSE